MAHKKFEVANDTIYQEYTYYYGQESYSADLTRGPKPPYSDYEYHYMGSYDFNDNNIVFVEILSYRVGASRIIQGPTGPEVHFTSFDNIGCYYNNNKLNFYGDSNILYPDSLLPPAYAIGSATVKIYKKGQELYGEIYDQVYIGNEDMMPMSDSIKDDNTTQVTLDDADLNLDGNGVGIYVDNSSNDFPVYITFDSGIIYTSGQDSYDINDYEWCNQAIGANSTGIVWYCNVYGETVTSADFYITISAPGYISQQLNIGY